MQLSILSIYAFTMTAFMASVQAAPSPAPAAQTEDFTSLTTESSINDCGPSTFVDESSGGSPSISDCQVITSNIAGGGSWTLIGGVQRTLVTYGSCAFGATADALTYIGNQDIIDLINSSINDFSWEGLVGASGTMNCGSSVTWGLYHT